MNNSYSLLKDSIKSLGVVFGDIGTSPIYTIAAVFAVLPVTLANVMGVLSLIVWTLVLLVTVQYAWLAMGLAAREDGEGGIIVLKEIVVSLLSSPALRIFVTILSFVGFSFFIGDGVITPAISILSAVEGLKVIPVLADLSQSVVIVIALLIAVVLFAVQKKGTERVSIAFGPIMLLWFIFLSFSGGIWIVRHPDVLRVLSPWYALIFLSKHGFLGLIVLSKVILCATGAEALYVDMGHLGRRPIIVAWVIVFISLVLIYLGQGAFLLDHPNASNVFYEMTFTMFPAFYIPILLLSIFATVIASQAMISGLFSIVYQGITTHMLPRLQVEYTSQRFMAQIYIPLVNKLLFVLVVLVTITFQYSQNLANAYGLAASGTMTITAILLTFVFVLKKNILKGIIAALLIPVNLAFFTANTYKIPAGGYWSLIIASIPLSFIILYTLGRVRLHKLLKEMPIDQFVEKFAILSENIPHINGEAVFLCKSTEFIPTYMVQTMFTNNIIYEENILVSVVTQKSPFGVVAVFKEDLAPGLRVFEIRAGYLEVVNIEKIFNAALIHPKVIFYGVEDVSAQHIFLRIFTLIKRLAPSFVQFYKLPRNKLHGVTVRVEI